MCLLLCAGVSVSMIGVAGQHKNFPGTMVMMILAGIFMEVRVRSQDTDTILHNNRCLPSCPQCRNIGHGSLRAVTVSGGLHLAADPYQGSRIK